MRNRIVFGGPSVAAGGGDGDANRNGSLPAERKAGVTTWIQTPRGGRDRGPRGLGRAWVEVLVRPGRFFRAGVAPGDQAPGLTFAIAVAVAFAAGWMLADPNAIPAIAPSPLLSAVVTLLVVGVLGAPVGLHLTAAVAAVSVLVASLEDAQRDGVTSVAFVLTLAAGVAAAVGPPLVAAIPAAGAVGTLVATRRSLGVRDRAGVSETVQVVAYASAPFAVAGPPVPALRVACAAYATVLLVVGIRTVHGRSWPRAAVAAVPPALVGFWVGYRALAAGRVLWTL